MSSSIPGGGELLTPTRTLTLTLTLTLTPTLTLTLALTLTLTLTSYDYCTSEDCDLTPAWDCHCGAAQCRGLIDPQDWRRPELQERYRGHFLPHISLEIASYQARRTAAAAGKEPAKQAEGGEAAASPLQVNYDPP